jgi:rhomboid protease GluP
MNGQASRYRWGASHVIIAVNAVMLVATGFSRNAETLLHFGATYPPAISSGEYWRLITAVFLHGGIFHFLLNAVALMAFGPALETIYGRWRFVALYLAAGVAGNAVSFAFGPVNSVGVGASGAIFGLLGGFLAFSFRRRHLPVGAQGMRAVMVIAGINLFIGATVPGIDNWAHVGGLLAGALVGLIYEALSRTPLLAGMIGPGAAMIIAGLLVARRR